MDEDSVGCAGDTLTRIRTDIQEVEVEGEGS
jgi:hypothetical protein